jgi:hypothetical protein
MQAFTGRLHRLIVVARYEARKLGATGVSMEAVLADLSGPETTSVASAGPSMSSAASSDDESVVYESSQEEYIY